MAYRMTGQHRGELISEGMPYGIKMCNNKKKLFADGG